MREPEIILAIESAVAGGSISLLRGGDEVANWIGDGQVSRAEDILPNIDATLMSAGIRLGEIDMIAVAAGPGSFTGIRIGIATALGLKSRLNMRLASRSSLQAMAFASALEGRVFAVLPVGRNTVCWQEFENGRATSEAMLLPEAELPSFLEHNAGSTHLLHGSLHVGYRSHAVKAVDFGNNLAHAVALTCRAKPDVMEPPIFLSRTF